METSLDSLEKELLATLTKLIEKHAVENILIHTAWVCLQKAFKIEEKAKLTDSEIHEIRQLRVSGCAIRHCAELVEYAKFTI